MSQVKGQVIRQRQDRKCPWAAILITKISVADNRLGISSQWPYAQRRPFSLKVGHLFVSAMRHENSELWLVCDR